MPNSQAPSEGQAKPSRRGFLWGAAAGAAVATVAALPEGAAPAGAQAEAQPEPPARGGGYRLSEHVKQYYKTTLV